MFPATIGIDSIQISMIAFLSFHSFNALESILHAVWSKLSNYKNHIKIPILLFIEETIKFALRLNELCFAE